MNMKKKIATACLCAALAATTVIGGSLAYLTDKDAETNTFTVGDVKIDLIESQYHRVNAGVSSAESKTTEVPLSGNVLWAPNVDMAGTPDNTPNFTTSGEVWAEEYFSDEQIKNDAATYKEGYFNPLAEKMVPGRNIRKNPYVINTGKNPAYIRIHAYIPKDFDAILDGYYTSTAINEGEITINNPNGDFVNYNGMDCHHFVFTYTDAVKPGEMTFWNPWGNVCIYPKVTGEQLAAVSADHMNVIFTADAIQAEGFADAASAFAAFDAQTAQTK